MLTLDMINDLWSGHRSIVWVGAIPWSVSVQLKIANPNVYCDYDQLQHIIKEHSHVTPISLLHLPFVISRGLLIQETVRPHIIRCSYQDPASHRRFVAAVKIANQNTEVWLSTPNYQLQRGDRVRIFTGGGGGWGPPSEREPEAVAGDMRAGLLSAETARKVYHVVVDPLTFAIDAAATRALRDQRR
jgi:hypothetical protein